jgi:hypothetical protein
MGLALLAAGWLTLLSLALVVDYPPLRSRAFSGSPPERARSPRRGRSAVAVLGAFAVVALAVHLTRGHAGGRETPLQLVQRYVRSLGINDKTFGAAVTNCRPTGEVDPYELDWPMYLCSWSYQSGSGLARATGWSANELAAKVGGALTRSGTTTDERRQIPYGTPTRRAEATPARFDGTCFDIAPTAHETSNGHVQGIVASRTPC